MNTLRTPCRGGGRSPAGGRPLPGEPGRLPAAWPSPDAGGGLSAAQAGVREGAPLPARVAVGRR